MILRKLLTRLGFNVERPFASELPAYLDHVWVDNVQDHRLAYATGWARKRFNEVVGTYVIEFYQRNGRFPEGNHHVASTSQRMIYFAPRRFDQSSGLLSAERSTAS